MKLLFVIIAIVILITCTLFFLAAYSRSMEAPGLIDGHLSPCPKKPNCISTESSNYAGINTTPIEIPATTTNLEALNYLKTLILEMGGKITSESKNYMTSTFSSSFFGFIDDLEIRIDEDKKVIHLRSASRVGHSDFGVNNKRVNIIKNKFMAKVRGKQ